MKPIGTTNLIQFLFKSIIALLATASASLADAQTLQTLHSFANTNGANPQAGLTLGADGNLYSTTYYGGSNYSGAVFKMNTNGEMFTIASFDSMNGANPIAALTLGSDGNFYGTTTTGGSSRSGTVFKVTTNGVLTHLVSFAKTNGEMPYAALTLGPAGVFYGTTFSGGSDNYGTAFKVTTNGELSTLASFQDVKTNKSGVYPYGGLVMGNDGNFYGTASGGGSNFLGTIFKITTNGTLTAIVTFNRTNGSSPLGSLTLGIDGNFYGTTYSGGGNGASIGYGTVFKMTTSGTITTLVSFDKTASNGNGTFTNLTGSYPNTALALGDDGDFYGRTYRGGSNGCGTIFKVTTNGEVTTVASLAHRDNQIPQAELTLGNDGVFYSTTYSGGSADSGTVFQVKTNGALTNLISFDRPSGAQPHAALTRGVDGYFYGTTYSGGNTNSGTLFRMADDGTLTTVFYFGGTNGSNPRCGLTLGTDGNFYGTTCYSGGDSNMGTIFKITTNGELTTLVYFANTNGANPTTALTIGNGGIFYGSTDNLIFKVTSNGVLTKLTTLSSVAPNELTFGKDGNLYGTTSISPGAVFKVTTNGVFTTLMFFGGTNGAHPYAAMTLGNGGDLYGTTEIGGKLAYGTIFKMKTNGVITTGLVSFDLTNGAQPQAALTLGTDGNFYGTTFSGGTNRFGTIFRVMTNGVLTTLVYFAETNGAYPRAALTLENSGYLYGTTWGGGYGSGGTIFRLSLPPTIVTQPQSRTNHVGATTEFAVSATSLSPITYQWQKNGTNLLAGGNISGVNTNTLTIASISAGDAASYSVIISNSISGVISSNATLTVTTIVPPTLALHFSGGSLQLNLAGILSNDFVVQYTTNLPATNWINLLSLTNLSVSPYQFLDPAGIVPPARFYRAFMQ